jgi:hypothetical protein
LWSICCSKANNNKTKTAKDGLQPITILDGLHVSKEFLCQIRSKMVLMTEGERRLTRAVWQIYRYYTAAPFMTFIFE